MNFLRIFFKSSSKRANVAVGGINVTERCNLECKMCHFNGPQAPKKAQALNAVFINKFLNETAPQDVWFASTGELFMDNQAVEYIRTATQLGHRPCVLTNGLLLTESIMDEILKAGVRKIQISVDAIDSETYRKVRGGDFNKILEVCAYLKSRKQIYADLSVGVNHILLGNTTKRQDEYIEFWRGKVDHLDLTAEYFEIFKFRNTFFMPEERVDCKIAAYLMPSGKISPCCAITVNQHYEDLDWLPHIESSTPAEAVDQLTKMYHDPSSELAKRCKKCDWWIMFAPHQGDRTPYMRSIQYN